MRAHRTLGLTVIDELEVKKKGGGVESSEGLADLELDWCSLWLCVSEAAECLLKCGVGNEFCHSAHSEP